jgi:hypothetical protein
MMGQSLDERVAAEHPLASYCLPRRQPPRGIAPARVFFRTAAGGSYRWATTRKGQSTPGETARKQHLHSDPFEAELLGEPGSLDVLPLQVGEPIRVARRGVVAHRYCEHEPAGAGVKRGMT